MDTEEACVREHAERQGLRFRRSHGRYWLLSGEAGHQVYWGAYDGVSLESCEDWLCKRDDWHAAQYQRAAATVLERHRCAS
jgi:hypothetical protein